METTFTASTHAILFALLSRAVVEYCGAEQGENLMRRAIRSYGEQRGRRMRRRAQRDGEPLTMLTYLAYAEWRVPKGGTEQRATELAPDQHSFVDRCPWNQAWVENDLLEYGRLYCQEIDQALVRGFNPQLKLDVLSTLSNDHQPCEFIFYGANFLHENLQRFDEIRAFNERNGGVMPWEYHAGHLYQAVLSVLMADLDGEGDDILQVALDAFALRYGEEAVRVLRSYQGVDFDRLSDELG